MQNDKFYEIYDYFYKPFWTTNWFKVVFLLFIILALTIIIIFLVKKFFKKKDVELTAWEWATNKLNSFIIKKLSTKDDFKNFYFSLTKVLKIYFHKRFNWQTKDKTDVELIKYIKEKNLDKKLVENLRQLTESALWIKYANQETLKTQAEKDLVITKQIIEKTKPFGTGSKAAHSSLGQGFDRNAG